MGSWGPAPSSGRRGTCKEIFWQSKNRGGEDIMDLSTSGLTTLAWEDQKPHLSAVFTKLQLHSSLVDVSLTCSTGQTVRCHKVLLAAASPYFQRLFSESGAKHPVVILPQVGLSELQDVVEYIYRGEISLNQSRLASFLSVSRSLQLSGLEKFIKEEVEEEEMDKGSDFAENDEAIPLDLSMKSQRQS